jgi:hypothetical protein
MLRLAHDGVVVGASWRPRRHSRNARTAGLNPWRLRRPPVARFPMIMERLSRVS